MLSGSGILPTYTIQEGVWPVNIDQPQISQVLENLVANARDAMPDGGNLAISVENIDIQDGEHLPLRAGK